MDFIPSIELNLSEKLRNRNYRRDFFEIEASAQIAGQLIELRKLRQMSQAALAEKIGTKQAGISRVESADYGNWNFNTLRKIAEALDARLRVMIEPSEAVLREYEEYETKIPTFHIPDTGDLTKQRDSLSVADHKISRSVTDEANLVGRKPRDSLAENARKNWDAFSSRCTASNS